MAIKPVFDESGNVSGIEITLEDSEVTQAQFTANQTEIMRLGRNARRVAKGVDVLPNNIAGLRTVLQELCELVARLAYETRYEKERDE